MIHEYFLLNQHTKLLSYIRRTKNERPVFGQECSKIRKKVKTLSIKEFQDIILLTALLLPQKINSNLMETLRYKLVRQLQNIVQYLSRQKIVQNVHFTHHSVLKKAYIYRKI